MNIHQATIADLEKIVPLFDLYRQFYGAPPDSTLARQFLSERIEQHQSIIFLATTEEQTQGNTQKSTGINARQAIGFVQLYPSFSSVSAGKILILNDLFVHPSTRKLGAGKALLAASKNYAQLIGAIYLSLSTGITNHAAQNLYTQNGWVRDENFWTYHWPCPNKIST